MSNEKISQMPPASSVGASDIIPIVQGGVNKSATPSLLGGQFSLTAATDIAAGTGVSVNASGDAVQTWGPAPNVAGVVTLFGGVAANPAALLLPGKVVYFYTGGAQVWTVSGQTISNGGTVATDAITTQIAATAYGPQGAYVEAVPLTGSTFVAVYNDSGTGNVNAVVGSIDGSNTITYGAPVQLFAQGCHFHGAGLCLAALSATLVLFNLPLNDSTQSTIACSVSGTTLTASLLAVQVSNNVFGGVGIAALTATTAALLYADGNNSGNLTVVVASLAGTVITLGAPAASTISVSTLTFVVALSATLIVAAGQGSSTTVFVAATVSGTTLSAFGSALSVAKDGSYLWIYPSSSTTAVVQTPIFSISVSGTTVSVGTLDVNKSINGTLALCGSTVVFSDNVNTIYEVDLSNNLSPGFTHPDASAYWLYPLTSATALATLVVGGAAISRVINVEPINPTSTIGATALGATNGNPVTVQNSGACGGFSGLSTSTDYYWNGDGTLTTADSGHPAGTAISSTQLALA